MKHQLSNESLFALPTRLNELSAQLQQDLNVARVGSLLSWSWEQAFGNEIEFLNWFDREVKQEGVANLHGNAYLWLSFSKSMVEIGSWVRWIEFIEGAEVSSSLRKICEVIGKGIGTDEIYYVPDSGPGKMHIARNVLFEGGSMEQFKQQLFKDVGEPNQTFGDLKKGGYYVEKL